RAERAEQAVDRAADRADTAVARADRATEAAATLRTALALPAVTDVGGTPGVPLGEGAGAVLAEDGSLRLSGVDDRHGVEAAVELARAVLAVAHTLR
ncbi:hypothetical protein, partial [Actinomadura sediminis]